MASAVDYGMRIAVGVCGVMMAVVVGDARSSY